MVSESERRQFESAEAALQFEALVLESDEKLNVKAVADYEEGVPELVVGDDAQGEQARRPRRQAGAEAGPLAAAVLPTSRSTSWGIATAVVVAELIRRKEAESTALD